jgi:uncharacterized protein
MEQTTTKETTMSEKRERRFLESEVKLESRGDSKPKITGYAAVFNKRSSDLGRFREVIDKRAFDAHLATNPDVVGLFNHSNDMVLGRTSSGTMRLSVDNYGLKYEIDPPNTSYAKDLMESMSRGDIRSSSFAFFADDEDWSVDSDTGENIRTIKQARLIDCSPVTAPAYPDATSQVRSMFPDGIPAVPSNSNDVYKTYMRLKLDSLRIEAARSAR